MTIEAVHEGIGSRQSTLSRFRRAIPWGRILIVLCILTIVAGSIHAGLTLRRAAWTWTADVRFTGDIRNGWLWGTIADKGGLFRFYETAATESSTGYHRRNDYTPLRLAVMTTWVRWAKEKYPGASSWREDYEFNEPLLRFNTACEAASAVLIFLIIRLWSARMDDAHRPPGTRRRAFRGVIAGLAGALLFWFNPAVIWTGHCWPQWDVWLIPFFLAALLLGSLDWWFTAAICVVIGAFLKGQMLLGAPVLLLWPLFQGRLGAVFRQVSGLVFATALIALPWMQLNSAAYWWCGLVVLSLLLLIPLLLRTRIKWPWALGLTVAAILLSYPWKGVSAGTDLRWAFVPIGAAMFIPMLPRGVRVQAYALLAGAAVFLTIPLFGSGTEWYTTGFKYGTEKFQMMTGNGSWNIPAILVKNYGWQRMDPDAPASVLFFKEPVPLKTVLRFAYGVCLVLCGIGAAMQARRRDTRFLAAVAAPWLLFFLLLTQMHGRYSIWAAGMAALLAGVSTGMALLGVVVATVAWMGIVENQYITQGYEAWFVPILRGLDPGIGWIYILTAGILLFVALTPRRFDCRNQIRVDPV